MTSGHHGMVWIIVQTSRLNNLTLLPQVEFAAPAHDEVEMTYDGGSISHESNGPGGGGDSAGHVLQESEPPAHGGAQDEHLVDNGAEVLQVGVAEYAQDDEVRHFSEGNQHGGCFYCCFSKA